MITPQDIQTKEFSRGVRGYKEDEVDIFLDELTNDYEAIINENIQLKAQLEELSAKVADYRNQEGAVVKTLEAAKGLMSDIAASAEKRADLLVKNAEIEAASIVRDAQTRLKALAEEETALTNRVQSYKLRFKSLLEAELKQFSTETENFEKKTAVDPSALKQFNDIINSVPEKKKSSDKDFFNDEAFKNMNDSLENTIVNLRKDIE